MVFKEMITPLPDVCKDANKTNEISNSLLT